MKTLKFISLMFLALLTSCVSQKKYSDLENQSQRFENSLKLFQSEQIVSETNLLERLSDLSVVSKTGVESIKKSLEALNEQNKYIKEKTH